MSMVVLTKSTKKTGTPKLTNEEWRNGCCLGFDSYADTSCAGRHAWIESYVEGKTVTANGFATEMGTLENLPIVNVLYAYISPDGEVFILRVNNSTYLSNSMEDSLLCPNQCRLNGIEINTRPKMYCDNDETTESIYYPEIQKCFLIRHHGPLPFLPVRRPTMEETLTCTYIDLTPNTDWDLYRSDSHSDSGIAKIATKSLREQGIISDDLQHIGKVLMGQNLDTIFEKERLLHSFRYQESLSFVQ